MNDEQLQAWIDRHGGVKDRINNEIDEEIDEPTFKKDEHPEGTKPPKVKRKRVHSTTLVAEDGSKLTIKRLVPESAAGRPEGEGPTHAGGPIYEVLEDKAPPEKPRDDDAPKEEPDPNNPKRMRRWDRAKRDWVDAGENANYKPPEAKPPHEEDNPNDPSRRRRWNPALNDGKGDWEDAGENKNFKPPKDPNIGKTEVINGNVMQWNPETGRFDINLGPQKAPEAAKPTVQEDAEGRKFILVPDPSRPSGYRPEYITDLPKKPEEVKYHTDPATGQVYTLRVGADGQATATPVQGLPRGGKVHEVKGRLYQEQFVTRPDGSQGISFVDVTPNAPKPNISAFDGWQPDPTKGGDYGLAELSAKMLEDVRQGKITIDQYKEYLSTASGLAEITRKREADQIQANRDIYEGEVDQRNQDVSLANQRLSASTTGFGNVMDATLKLNPYVESGSDAGAKFFAGAMGLSNLNNIFGGGLDTPARAQVPAFMQGLANRNNAPGPMNVSMSEPKPPAAPAMSAAPPAGPPAPGAPAGPAAAAPPSAGGPRAAPAPALAPGGPRAPVLAPAGPAVAPPITPTPDAYDPSDPGLRDPVPPPPVPPPDAYDPSDPGLHQPVPSDIPAVYPDGPPPAFMPGQPPEDRPVWEMENPDDPMAGANTQMPAAFAQFLAPKPPKPAPPPWAVPEQPGVVPGETPVSPHAPIPSWWEELDEGMNNGIVQAPPPPIFNPQGPQMARGGQISGYQDTEDMLREMGLDEESIMAARERLRGMTGSML